MNYLTVETKCYCHSYNYYLALLSSKPAMYNDVWVEMAKVSTQSLNKEGCYQNREISLFDFVEAEVEGILVIIV